MVPSVIMQLILVVLFDYVNTFEARFWSLRQGCGL